MADVPRMTDDERRETTIAALKRERDQHARRTDETGVRRVAEIDAQLEQFGADPHESVPQGRGRRRTATAD